jgi:hypothetical protein
MPEFCRIRSVRRPHIQPSLTLTILHVVLIAAVTWTVIISTPLYG